MTVLDILVFILVLIVLVIVHEAGHFFAAKLLKIPVDEFAFGFPPRLFSKKYKETVYAFNLLPLGGYVSIRGENPSDHDHTDKMAFNNRPAWQKVFVLIGGVTMNLVLAWVLLIAAAWGNVTVSTSDSLFANAQDKRVIVLSVAAKSPADRAGIKAGDTIVSIISGPSHATLDSGDEAVKFIRDHIDEVSITWKNRSSDAENSATLAGVYGVSSESPDRKLVGLGLDEVATAHRSLLPAIKEGSLEMASLLGEVWHGFLSLFSKLVHGQGALHDVTGPVGIAKVTSDAREIGIDSLLFLVAVLSINLAFFNALPFPALDGGRIAIVLGESLTRRKMKPSHFRALNSAGFFLLMLLFVVVTLKDIFK